MNRYMKWWRKTNIYMKKKYIIWERGSIQGIINRKEQIEWWKGATNRSRELHVYYWVKESLWKHGVYLREDREGERGPPIWWHKILEVLRAHCRILSFCVYLLPLSESGITLDYCFVDFMGKWAGIKEEVLQVA